MATDELELLNGLTIDEVLKTWFKYDCRSSEPEFVLILGNVGGKTRLRHERYAESHVNVDAGDIFRRLTGDRIFDFPGEHRAIINMVGRMIAEVAISEKFNLVTELHHPGYPALKALSDAMLGIGYKLQVNIIELDFEEAQRRNLARGPHNISAYYTDEFHVRWLMDAVARENKPASGGLAA